LIIRTYCHDQNTLAGCPVQTRGGQMTLRDKIAMAICC
jgi:hypothetical protein